MNEPLGVHEAIVYLGVHETDIRLRVQLAAFCDRIQTHL